MSQTTIFGEEVPHPGPARAKPALTPAQRAILRHIGEHGHIRSVEAGIIVHEHRTTARRALENGRLNDYLAAVRRYAPADGLEAMKRLAKQGLVRRVSPGRWET